MQKNGMSYVVFLFKQTAMKITVIHMPTSNYKQSYNLVKSIMYNLCKTVKKIQFLLVKFVIISSQEGACAQ